MSYQNITLQIVDRTAILTINREAKLNALNKETIGELKDALAEISTNDEAWGVLLTGAGEKAFVAGADIQEFMDKSKAEASELSRFGHELMDSLATFPKPTIAAINGFALGGGLELALGCHLRIASTNAKMGLPEVSLGLIPGYGGTQRLAQLVGRGKALEMLLTGDMITAQDALQWGLVNHVVEQDALIAKAQEILQKMYSRSKTALAAAIRAVNATNDPRGFEAEIEAFGQCFGEPDFQEGVSAFLEKRKPSF